MSRRLRTWIVVGVSALAVMAVIGAVALVRSRSADCSFAPPAPDLPDRLRAVGDFDRPYDAGGEQDLGDVAERAAAALHPDLIGTSPDRSVRVEGGGGDRHDALVVPLTAAPGGSRPRQVSGLVAFLLDCRGRAYYSATQDVSSRNPPLAAFPAIPRATAAGRLGEDDLTLIYRDSPFRPAWHAAVSREEIPAT